MFIFQTSAQKEKPKPKETSDQLKNQALSYIRIWGAKYYGMDQSDIDMLAGMPFDPKKYGDALKRALDSRFLQDFKRATADFLKAPSDSKEFSLGYSALLAFLGSTIADAKDVKSIHIKVSTQQILACTAETCADALQSVKSGKKLDVPTLLQKIKESASWKPAQMQGEIESRFGKGAWGDLQELAASLARALSPQISIPSPSFFTDVLPVEPSAQQFLISKQQTDIEEIKEKDKKKSNRHGKSSS